MTCSTRDAFSNATATGGASAPTADEYSFRFEGSGGEYFLIFLKHVFLTLVTFGIYFAWAKSERRAFIWKGLSFHDHPFRYTGTGLELFKGYVLLSVAYLAFFGVPAFMTLIHESLGFLVQVALVVGVVAIIPFVIYRSRAFLYNRTTWRGIRFGLLREYLPFAKTFFIGIVLTVLSLGLYAPVNANRLHGMFMNNTRFGSLTFRYDGDDWEVWVLSMKGYALTLVTLGIYYFWYRAELERYRAAHTHVGDSGLLCSDVTGVQLLIIYLVNIFGLTFSLGLAFPWILMFSLSELADRYSVRGLIDFDEIVQRAEEEGAFAEGMADALDLDFGF
jgi:uncharacterized membrane protein YjgN (DUF898 family)